MPGDYEHDVFFSYKRDDLNLYWRTQVLNILKRNLAEELRRPATVFVDSSDIDVGHRWPDSLRQALKSSRCLVCLWSPLYFQSAWCVSEWRSFLERERRFALRSHGLIAPLKFHDGAHFPPEAQTAQWLDVEQYSSILPVFWNTPRALELEDKLKLFAKSVAVMVGDAPPFADWPVFEQDGEPAPNIELRRL